MSNALSEMNYDANKLPLGSFSQYIPKCLPTEACVGKLAKSTILSGFAALKELSEVINQPDSSSGRGFSSFRAACEELTSRYFSWVFVTLFRAAV